ncbi:putative Endonuclease/exonuclease/phosphatase superfamily [Helianthus debilis subsp. tardiflorus]
MHKNSPSRIIWFGDLNYRIALSYRSAKDIVEVRNWRALLANDQLRIEQTRERVFNGWNGGYIFLTHSNNSDRHACIQKKTKDFLRHFFYETG